MKNFIARLVLLIVFLIPTLVVGETVLPQLTGLPLSAGQSPSAYLIDNENVLQIDVFYGKGQTLSQKVRVSSAGTINFPLIGNVSAAGLTIVQLQDKLVNLLSVDYLVNPQVTVFIEEYSTASIMGEVKSPGAYPIKGRLNVVGLVSLAQGFGELASPNEVKIVRFNADGQKTEIVVPVLDIMNTAEADNRNYLLHSGDVVVVPKSTVSIMGEVKKAGVYPTKGRLTLVELISLAEGFTEFASPNEVKVVRANADGSRTETLVRVQDPILKEAGGGESFLLRSGDMVMVPVSKVYIMGEVKKPGAYPTKGKLSVMELISLAEGFTPQASPNEVKVIHTNPDGSKVETAVKMGSNYNNKLSEVNDTVMLNSGDVVVVPEGKVTVMGQVNKPGTYPTKGRLTILEVIAMAEGFNKIAAPNKVKVFHTNSDGTRIETVVKVNDMINNSSTQTDPVLLESGDVIIVPESIF